MMITIYASASTEDQAKRNTDDIQLEALRRMVADSVEYVDDGVSGKIPLGERPGSARLLADARAKKFSEVVVYKLDRLGRSLRGILDAYDVLNVLGVSFRSATESIDTSSAFGRGTFQFLAIIAEWEHGRIVERTMAGKRRIASEGKWHGGECPHG